MTTTSSNGGGGYRISVDTGGTFTDVVLASTDGNLISTKAVTRADDPWPPVDEALGLIAGELGVSVLDLLQDTLSFSYATTRATNAILTDATATTAFVSTEGFPDILTLRQGGRHDPFDFETAFPTPYVPRSLTFELPGRIDAQGKELQPFSPAAAEEIVRRIVERGCESIAVCLLWSHVNPLHELAFADVVERLAPELTYTLSHVLNPVVREYPRASSTALDASLKPLMQGHFRALAASLNDAGFVGNFLAVTTSGGCLPMDEMVDRPILCVDSGPSVAPVAARAYADEVGSSDVLVYDAGGTSFDVTLIAGGEIATTRDRWLGQEFTGHLLGISSIAVHSIGAGGGSIAWLDSGGLLRIGPQSAGSMPGPACYGLGGTQPTVTDAAAVCGHLDPDFFLAGRLSLDVDAAAAVIDEHIASPLGLTVERASDAILTVATDAMVDAIHQITVNQGVDPRESLLVAGGGAGGLNVVAIARELGCASALVPRAAGTLSAAGGLFSDLRAEFTRSAVTRSDNFDGPRVAQTLELLDDEVDQFLRVLGRTGLAVGAHDRGYLVEARYPDQVWDLRVPVAAEAGQVSAAALADAIVRFHDLHDRTFAVNDPAAPIECQQWTATISVRLPRPSLDIALIGDDAAHGARTRTAWFDGEPVETTFVFGATLSEGDTVEGPAVILEATTTVVLPSHALARVLPSGSYLIEV
jgi:N-methylhydantoinase A